MVEPNEALNDSLKHKQKLSDEEYCIECPHKNDCSEWNAKIICDLNYYNWLQKVKVCRERR